MSKEYHLLHNPSSGPCAVCGARGSACTRCRNDYYCGKDHQSADWARHKAGCGVIKMRTDAQLGRHLVATKDIPAGTVLMVETPLVAAPFFNRDHPDLIPCVGCFAGPQKWVPCSGCGFPLCRQQCGSDPVHRAECEAFKRAKFKVNKNAMVRDAVKWYTVLAALRTCLAAKDQPRIWDLQDKMKMPDEAALRQMEPEVATTIVGAVIHMSQQWGETELTLRSVGINWLPIGNLQRAAALLDVNRFMDDSAQDDGRLVLTLYGGTSLLEHSCKPNTWGVLAETDHFTMKLFAARDLKKGEHISTSYIGTPSFLGTAKRQKLCGLRGFVCCCELCRDPTEGGLHLGSSCCRHCTEGEPSYIKNGVCGKCQRAQPESVLESLEEELGDLECRLSQGVVGAQMEAWEGAEEEDLDSAKKGIGAQMKAWENFIKKHLWPRGALHPTHELILRTKLGIVRIAEVSGMTNTTFSTPKDIKNMRGDVLRWEALGRDLLQILEMLCPGMNGIRRNVLYFLYKVLLQRAVCDVVEMVPKTQVKDLTMSECYKLINQELPPMMITESDREYHERQRSRWLQTNNFLNRAIQ